MITASGENSLSKRSTFTAKLENGLSGKENPGFEPIGSWLRGNSNNPRKGNTNDFLCRTRNEERRGQGGVSKNANFRSREPRDVYNNSVVQIRAYNPPNWFDSKGVYRKRLEIEKKGLPILKRCKMVTLTLDPIIGNPVKAYEKGKDRLRRFLASFRSTIGRSFAWAWKLEFQENGYAHWHLIIDYKKKIPREGLEMMAQWWGLGRINVKAIKRKDFRYLFKYVSKGVFSESNESGINLPDWVLDYRRLRKDGRPTSGIRFWQTGGGFYTNRSSSTSEKKEKKYSKISYTIRQQVEIWNRKATAIVADTSGCIVASRQFFLNNPWSVFFQNMVFKLIDGTAAYIGDSWRCRVNQIEREVQLWHLKKLRKLELLT